MPDEGKGWFGGEPARKGDAERTGWFGGVPLTDEEKRRIKQGNLGDSKPPTTKKPGPKPKDDSEGLELKTPQELAEAWGVELRVVLTQIAERRIPVVDTKTGPRIPSRAFDAAVAHGAPSKDNPLPRPRTPQKRGRKKK